MPPPDIEETAGAPLDTGPMPVVQIPPPTSQPLVSALMKDGRVLLAVAALVVGTPGATAVINQMTGGGEELQEAIDAGRDRDKEILDVVAGTNAKVDALVDKVGEVSTEQSQLQVSINGDATTGAPGIKGQIAKQDRKLDYLKTELDRVKRRDLARDKVERLDVKLRDTPLERDEWDDP